MTLGRRLSTIQLRLRSIFRRSVVEQELDEELRGHVERLVAEETRQGLAPEEIDALTRRAVREMEYTKEQCRETRRVTLLEQTGRDFTYAARVLRRSPTFTAVAALTLALGVGINVTMFTVVDAVVLRAAPFAEPEQLVRVLATKGSTVTGDPSALDMRDVAAVAQSVRDLVVFDQWRKNVRLTATDRPAEMVVGLVPGEYFKMLRVSPIMGRLFIDGENRYGNHYVAAISENLWRNRFGARRDILGQTVQINDESYHIVAVMPDAVPAWLEARRTPTLIWTPFAPNRTTWDESSRGQRGYATIGRLRPGATLDQARTELSQLAARLAATYPADRLYGLTAQPLIETRVGKLGPMLVILTAAVAAVLMIACANLANLLFARNATRQRELQLRMALGASRGRLCRQLLVETFVLAGLGAGVGFLLSLAGSAAVERWHSPSLPQLADLSIDGRVLAFTLSVSLITALGFGLGPAWTTSRVDLATALRGGGRSGTGTLSQRHVRSALVVAEVALALVLVTATALLTRSALNLTRQDLGFPTDHLLKAHIYIPPARYPDAAAVARFADRFDEAIRALPGVRNATVTISYPPADARWVWPVSIEGQPPSHSSDVSTTYLGIADAWYFRTLSIPIVRGRDFATTDAPGAPPVAIVNETFVRTYLAARDPIGAQVRIGNTSEPNAGASARAITIVGVARDVKNDGLGAPPHPQLIGLHSQLPEFNVEFKDVIVRTSGDPRALAEPLHRTLAALDPDMPLAEVATFDDVVAMAVGERPYVTLMLAAFAALGLALAAIGIYGVVAYGVTQRTAEIGIRSALGATRLELILLVARNGLALGATGAVAGILVSIGASRLLADQMFGLSALDPVTLASTAAALMIVAALASVVPAVRAARIDPVRALRA
jgi:putative ABC transport system permease protein